MEGSAREGGRNENGAGRMHSKSGMETRTTVAERMTAEQVRGGQGQEKHRGQVISNGEGGG